MSYQRRWKRWWAGVVAVGVCWAGIVLPLSLAIGVLCLGGLAVALACAALQDDGTGDVRVGFSAGVWKRLLWGGTSCLAVAGLLRPAPALVGLLLVVAAVSSPAVVARVRRLVRRRSDDEGSASASSSAAARRPVTEPARPRHVEAFATMSDAALCGLWTDTYWALKRASSDSDRVVLVELRGHVLDEMDRRDPRAITTWLAGGPRPHQSPRAFFRDQ